MFPLAYDLCTNNDLFYHVQRLVFISHCPWFILAALWFSMPLFLACISCFVFYFWCAAGFYFNTGCLPQFLVFWFWPCFPSSTVACLVFICITFQCQQQSSFLAVCMVFVCSCKLYFSRWLDQFFFHFSRQELVFNTVAKVF